MNTLSTMIEPLGWALLHFLWQGAVIALLLRGFLWLTRRRSPQVRYAAAGAAMLLMLGAAAGTVWWQWRSVRPASAVEAGSVHRTDEAYTTQEAREPLMIEKSAPAPLPAVAVEESLAPAALPAIPAVPAVGEKPTTADRLRPMLPWMLGVWAAGVLFFSLRLLHDWRVVRRWRVTANDAIPCEWAVRFSRLCERLGIAGSVRLLSSATFAVPVVIGWLKPAVLVPASLFTGLSTGQLEALLAHELAHVRRHDYLVNLLQSALETLFFYHPAVWWVSGQLRNEREHCCDDVATSLAGGVLAYARALTALEEMRAVPAVLGISAAGGSLLQRIRRLTGVSEPRTSGVAWPLGFLALATAAAVLPLTLLDAAPARPSAAVIPGTEDGVDEKAPGVPADRPGEWEQLLKVTSDISKFETELDISLPAAEAANAKRERRADELVINVKEDGSVVWNGKSLTLEELTAQLAEIAKADKKRAIIIRGNEATPYEKIVAVLRTTHKAGLHYVSFATTTAVAGDRKSAAKKLLEEGGTLGVDGLSGEARVKLEALHKLLGTPGDPGFPDEDLLILADAEMVAGRLDQQELKLLNTETPDARQTAATLRETALNHFTDAAKLLLDYDTKDKKSVPCRSRLGSAYFEMGGILNSHDSPRDASVAYSEAVKIYTELLKEEPGNPVHALELAKTYDAVAILLRAVKPGDAGVREALDYQQHSVTLLRPLVEKEPKDFVMVMQLSASLKLNSELHKALGDTAAADAALKEGSLLMNSLSDAEKIRGAQVRIKRSYFDPRAAPDAKDSERQAENFSRVFQHKDGSRTESVRKDGNLRESTYNKQGDLLCVRVFTLDKKGRVRQGVIYDGEKNPLGSILYGYDPKTEQPVEERQFDKKGRLIRRLFYPGAIKDRPEFADKFAAFTYDPENPRAKPVIEFGEVKPMLPASEAKDASSSGMKLKLWSLSIPEKTADKTAEEQLALAKELRQKLVDGADFATLAKEHSRDSKQESGGDWGWVERKDITKEAWEIASRLPSGQMSEILPMSGQLLILRVEASQEGTTAEVKRQTALAEGFYDLGQYEKAREGFEQVLKLDPSNGEVQKLLERVTSKLAHQADPFAVPTHPDVLVEARKTSLSLTVKDADGRKGISEFRVIAGVRSQAGGGKDVVNWQPHTLRVGTNGGMMWPLDKAYDEMALRVEADGCAPQVFNWIEKKKGPQDLFFQLSEDQGIPGEVRTPDGQPASGATVAIAMVQRDAVIEGGKLRQEGADLPEKAADRWRLPRLIQVDAGGGFMLPAENDPTAAVLIVHHTGVLEMSLAELKKSPAVTLQPWGRIEGKVQWGDKPGAGQKVSLTIHRDTYGYPGIIAQYEKTTAAADGSFVFEKVLPGHVQLSCPIAAAGNAEINLTGRIAHVDVKPGTNQAVIGGGGRTVKGKLSGRDSWDGVTFHFHPTAPHVGFPGDDEMWKAWSEFQKSPSGPLFFRNGLKVNADGTFEISGVLPGDYQIFFSSPPPNEPAQGIRFDPPADKKVPQARVVRDFASGKFSVHVETPGQKPEPLDAGEFSTGK